MGYKENLSAIESSKNVSDSNGHKHEFSQISTQAYRSVLEHKSDNFIHKVNDSNSKTAKTNYIDTFKSDHYIHKSQLDQSTLKNLGEYFVKDIDQKIFIVNLNKSKDGPTQNLDHLIVSSGLADSDYNCHYYLHKFLYSNYKPTILNNELAAEIINQISKFLFHSGIGSTFPTDKILNKYGYVKINESHSLESNVLKTGDIVCVVDKSYNKPLQEVHSAIVIGFDTNKNAILRQKFNNIAPVVDMNASGFNDIELARAPNSPSTKYIRIYRKQTH